MKKVLVLYYLRKDNKGRPVYENGDNLFVDVEPRADKQPKLCTVYGNCLNGEPDTPIEYMSKYKDAEIVFDPKRVTW